MRVSRFLVVLLATVVGVGITTSLGFWQLGRAQTKLDLFEAQAQRDSMPALGPAEWPCTEAQWRDALQRQVQLRGHWLPQHTVFLDNRAMDGKAGRFVLTPLRLEPGPGAHCAQQVVLVQRGWVPRDAQDRLRVPDIVSAPGPVTLLGRVSEAPSRMFELGEAAAITEGAVRQNVSLDALAREWSLPLLPGSVLQLADEQPPAQQAVPLLRHWWRPQADVGKHHAYAAQWFAMAAVMVLLFVWLQWWRPRQASAS